MAQTPLLHQFFDAPVGSFAIVPRGPRSAAIAAPGFAAILPGTDTFYTYAIPGTPADIWCGGWMYVKSFTTNNTQGVGLAQMWDAYVGGNPSTVLHVRLSTRMFEIQTYNAATQTLTIPMPVDQWFWIGTLARRGIPHTLQWYYKPSGGALTQLGVTKTSSSGGSNWQSFKIGAHSGGATNSLNNIRGVMGAVTIDSVSANTADAFIPLDVIDPDPAVATYYVNAATGSDTNTGLASNAAFQTISRLNTLLGRAEFRHGDTVTIENMTTPLDLGANVLTLGSVNNATMNLIGSPKFTRVIAGPWTQYSSGTYPNIWQTTDASSADLASTVIWEDDKWLTKRNGANIAAVAATLNTPGTYGGFYVDDKCYIYSTTDPNTNGKVYTRSRNRTAGYSAISLVNCGGTTTIQGSSNCTLSGTTIADKSTADAIGAYCLEVTGGSGTVNINDITFTNWSRHACGRIGDTTNVTVNRNRLTFGAGSPYSAIGSTTSDVDYALSGTGNVGTWTDCVFGPNLGSIGSTGGVYNANFGAVVMHGLSTLQFTSETFTRCSFGPLNVSEQANVGAITLIDCDLTSLSSSRSSCVWTVTRPKATLVIAGASATHTIAPYFVTASKLLSGENVGNGTTGTLTLPAANKVDVTNGAYGVGGTGSTPTLDSAALASAAGAAQLAADQAAVAAQVNNIRSGISLLGSGGLLAPYLVVGDE